MVREYETDLYEKQLKEVGRFSLKKKRLTKKYYRDHSFQILEKILHRLGYSVMFCPQEPPRTRAIVGETQEEHRKELDKSHAKRNGHRWRQIPSLTSLELSWWRMSVSAHIMVPPGLPQMPYGHNISFPCTLTSVYS